MTRDETTTLMIDGMTCASCVGRVERTLAAQDGVGEVAVNLASETARVRADDPEALVRAALALEELGYPARRAKVTLNVASMSCASCVGRVDKALEAVPGVLEVSVNLAAETATVTYLEGATTPAALIAASTEIGYPAEIAEATATTDRAACK